MATIASLNVLLGMNTRGFSKGAKRAKNEMKGLRAAMGAVTKVAGGLGIALGAGAAFSKFRQEIAETLESIDALAKRADRLQIDTASLGGLEFAAGLAGSNAATLGKALEKMTAELGKAQQGIGQAGKAVTGLGLDLDELTRIPADRALGKIADRFRQLQTPAEKAAVAQQLFGRSGIELINLLEQGSRGLDRQSARFRELGGAVSRLDAAKIEMANDAMSELIVAADGLSKSATVELAPALSLWATGMAEVVAGFPTLTETLELSRVKTQSFTDAVIAQALGMKGLGPVIGEVRDAYSDWADEQARLVLESNKSAAAAAQQRLVAELAEAAADKYVESLRLQVETFGMATREAELFRRTQAGLSEEQQRQAQEQIDRLSELEAARDAAAEAARRQAETERKAARQRADAEREGFNNFRDGLLSSAREQQRQRDKMEADAQGVFDATRTPQEEFKKAMEDFNRLLDGGAIDFDAYNRAADAARGTLDDLTGANKRAPNLTFGAPQALERGTAAAFSAVNASNRASDPVLAEMKKQHQQKIALDKKRNDKLEELVRKQPGGPPVAEIP